MSDASVLARRLAAQGLGGPPAGGPLDATRRLLAVQAQDPRGARLAIRARTVGGHVSDVERALSEDRSLVITWVNRGTLHLVAAEDEPLLHVLRTPQLHNESERRLRVEGIDGATAERAVAGIVRGLSDGPLTRRQIRELLDRAGVPTAGLAVAHVGAVDVARCARGSWRDRLRARAAGRWSGRAAPGLECGKG